jgi:hypothetical protein
MDRAVTTIDVRKLDEQLRLVRFKQLLAIVVGDSRAVARLTCEAARLRDAISLAGAMVLSAS